MDFSKINWKTSAAAFVVLAAGALSTFAGVQVPGFNMDFGAAAAIAAGLFFAKDAANK